jgi:hypothetical protein
MRVDSEGLGLQLRDGSESSVAKDRIVEMRVQRPYFPRIGESLLGFAIGTIAGGIVAATNASNFHPTEDTDGAFPPSVYRDNTVLLGAVTGLVVGTIVPFIYPGEDKVECAWTAPAPNEEPSSEAPHGRDHGFARLGALVGATYGYSKYENDFDGIKPFGGIRSEYVLRNGLGAQVGLQWSPKGYGYYPVIPEYSNGAVRFKYLAAPVRAIYRFRQDRRLPSLLALGIESAYLLDAYATWENEDGNVKQRDITDRLERWDFGISVGTAIGLSRSVEIGLEYVHGLSSVEGNPYFDNPNRSFWLFTSVWLDLS